MLMSKKLISLFISFLLVGCSAEKNIPSKYFFHFTKNDNYDLPVKIHIFILKNNFEFMTGDFYDLQRKPKILLGDNLITEKTFIYLPHNKNESYSIVPDAPLPSSVYVGLLAEYINLSGITWRLSSPVPPYPKTFSAAILTKDTLLINIIMDAQGLHLDSLNRK